MNRTTGPSRTSSSTTTSHNSDNQRSDAMAIISSFDLHLFHRVIHFSVDAGLVVLIFTHVRIILYISGKEQSWLLLFVLVPWLSILRLIYSKRLRTGTRWTK